MITVTMKNIPTIFCRSNSIFYVCYLICFCSNCCCCVLSCAQRLRLFLLFLTAIKTTITKTKKKFQISRSLTRLSLSPRVLHPLLPLLALLLPLSERSPTDCLTVGHARQHSHLFLLHPLGVCFADAEPRRVWPQSWCGYHIAFDVGVGGVGQYIKLLIIYSCMCVPSSGRSRVVSELIVTFDVNHRNDTAQRRCRKLTHNKLRIHQLIKDCTER